MIKIKAIGPLNRYLEQLNVPWVESDLCENVEDVKIAAGIPLTVQTVIVVNGKIATKDQLIQDGDNVLFMSPISGG